MAQKSKIIQGLEDYLNNTPPEQLKKDWEELEKYNQYGPEMEDCLDLGEAHCQQVMEMIHNDTKSFMEDEKKIYAVYESDAWLSKQSEVQMGIFTSVDLAINAIIDNNRFNLDEILNLDEIDEDMSEEDKYQMMDEWIREDLERSWQVSGTNFSYYIKEVELNKWNEI